MSEPEQFLVRRRYMRSAGRDPDGVLAAEEERREITIEASKERRQREQAAGEKAAQRRAVEAKRLEEQARHDRVMKLRAAEIRDRGTSGWHCPVACTICNPKPVEPEPKSDLVTIDLRAGAKPGKRGTCKICGKKCKTPRRVLCDNQECRKESRRQRNLRPCVGCQGPLPPGSRRDRKWCSEPCRKRHQRAARVTS